LAIGLDDIVRIAVFLLVACLIPWLDAARKRLTTALKQRAEELAHAHRHKDQFLAILAHELRNPLAAMCSAMQLRHAKRGKGGRGCDGGQLLNLS